MDTTRSRLDTGNAHRSTRAGRGHAIAVCTTALLLASLTASCGNETSQADASAASPTTTASTNALVFSVRHPDIGHASYLFGTHHAFGNAFIDRVPGLTDALKEIQTLVTETGTLPSEGTTAIINARTSTTDWTRYFRRGELDTVREIFSNGDVDLGKLTPSELGSALFRYHAMTVCEARAEGDAGGSLDESLIVRAMAAGKTVVGLESPADQLELLNQDLEGMPDRRHRERLRGVLSLITGEDTRGCGNAVIYAAMQTTVRPEQPCTNSLLLTDRNNRWMEQLLPRLRSEPTLVAVGQSHLMFACGLIAQLRAAGYEVEPVTGTSG